MSDDKKFQFVYPERELDSLRDNLFREIDNLDKRLSDKDKRIDDLEKRIDEKFTSWRFLITTLVAVAALIITLFIK